MMPRYGIDTTGTHRGYDGDSGTHTFYIENEVPDMIQHNMWPTFKNPAS